MAVEALALAEDRGRVGDRMERAHTYASGSAPAAAPRSSCPVHSGAVMSLTVTADGDAVVSGGADRAVRAWRLGLSGFDYWVRSICGWLDAPGAAPADRPGCFR